MGRYHVAWHPTALGELASIWIDAVDREWATTAADAIDNELRINPRSKGSDMGNGRYGLEVGPLYIAFEVVDEDGLVRVLAVAPIWLE
ncbi:MAG: type II toxin-antitoxin system RelE/ParE family toxin [Planctomycetes bacterium]|nr:type II toxin-antitoxin system RelE/ParE family toxin [Planctomycetota bacterium]